MLISAGGSRTNRFLTQAGIQRVPLQVGEFIQQRLGLGGGREDAADRRQREGTEADGTLQRGQHVGTLIMSR